MTPMQNAMADRLRARRDRLLAAWKEAKYTKEEPQWTVATARCSEFVQIVREVTQTLDAFDAGFDPAAFMKACGVSRHASGELMFDGQYNEA